MSVSIVAEDGRSHGTLPGIACGMGAGALWGLVFLAPELAREFSPLDLAIGRYLFYGLLSIALIAPRWRGLRLQLTARQWIALGTLSFTGNILYFILLSSAVQLGGIVMTSLVIGFLPVGVTIIGSRDKGAVPLRRLAPSLGLCAAGAVCIGWDALAAPAGVSAGPETLGFLCAIGALISWTAYAVSNSRWLGRVTHISASDWNLLVGLVTGAQAILLLPIAMVMDSGPHTSGAWAELAGISLGVAVLASIAGNLLWNRMSRLLPLTLVGQMILFETIFALIYGLLWEQRFPTIMEIIAFGLVVSSVLSCVAAHWKRSAH